MHNQVSSPSASGKMFLAVGRTRGERLHVAAHHHASAL